MEIQTNIVDRAIQIDVLHIRKLTLHKEHWKKMHVALRKSIDLAAKFAVAVVVISPAVPNAATVPGASLLVLNKAWIDIGSVAASAGPGAATPARPAPGTPPKPDTSAGGPAPKVQRQTAFASACSKSSVQRDWYFC